MSKNQASGGIYRESTKETHGIERPDIHDVLCGRGGLANNFSGNKEFRSNVDRMKEEYVQSKRARKTEICRGLVSQWRALDPPGRFLEKDETGSWSEIGDKRAFKKTSQLLREDAPLIRELVETWSSPVNMIDGNGAGSDDFFAGEKRKPPIKRQNLVTVHKRQKSVLPPISIRECAAVASEDHWTLPDELPPLSQIESQLQGETLRREYSLGSITDPFEATDRKSTLREGANGLSDRVITTLCPFVTALAAGERPSTPVDTIKLKDPDGDYLDEIVGEDGESSLRQPDQAHGGTLHNLSWPNQEDQGGAPTPPDNIDISIFFGSLPDFEDVDLESLPLKENEGID